VASLNVSDFTLTIVPLAILIFILVAAVLFYVKREEIANERKIKYIAAYLKENKTEIKNRNRNSRIG